MLRIKNASHSFNVRARWTISILLNFATLSDLQREQAAAVLHLAFSGVSRAYGTMSLARGEVQLLAESSDWVGFAALNGGRVIGWIGAIESYGGHAWELHPLAVHPESQRQGVGSALLAALEIRAAAVGAVTLFVGTDDEFGGTNLFSRNLYPEPLDSLKQLQAASAHPFTFYLRRGFVVTGIIPDANGPGKQDIFMAKRLGE